MAPCPRSRSAPSSPTRPRASPATRVATAAETLDVVIDLVPENREASWLEVACGPAVISRALAAKVARVRGVDLTPAMVEKAREEAAREGVDNVEFSVGDATSLELEDACSLKHRKVPRAFASAASLASGAWCSAPCCCAGAVPEAGPHPFAFGGQSSSRVRMANACDQASGVVERGMPV